jgi:hypothetical protein
VGEMPTPILPTNIKELEMNEELEKVKKIFDNATLDHNQDRDVYRIYFDVDNRNRGKSYITDNHITGVYYLFLDGFAIPSRDFNKILAVLQAIKDCEE